MATAVLNNITNELVDLFNKENLLNLSYHYVSTLDEKYKKMVGNSYTTDMKRCDTKILLKPRITPWMKEKHVLEIVDEVSQDVRAIQKSKNLKNEHF